MTGQQRVPNFHARRLARELTRLRHGAGLAQRDAFGTTRINVQKLCRIESGQLPTFVELQALLDLYGVPVCDWAPYEDIWNRAKEKAWWVGMRLRDADYVSDEHEASSIREVQSVYLPVLLQTETYARRLLETALPRLSSDQLAVELEARMRRGHRLDGPDPTHLHALIYQPALAFGVDVDQLKHLRDRAEQANVILQVVPYLNGPHAGLESSFSLMSFPGKDEPDVTHSGDRLGPTRTDDTEQIAVLAKTFEALAERAMSPENSLTYLENLIDHREDDEDDQ